MRLEQVCCLIAGTFVFGSAAAHHAVPMHFDRTKTIEIRGEIVEFKLRSPHTHFVVDGYAFADGVQQSETIERWEVESGSVPQMKAMGMEADTFRPGDPIRIVASPNRDPDFRFVYSRTFIAADGTEYSGFRPEEALSSADRLSGEEGISRMEGRWRVPLVPPDYESTPFPLSDAGRQAYESYDPKLSPANTCEPPSLPSQFYVPYLWDVEFSRLEVVFHYQAWNITRTIALGGTAPADRDGLYGIVTGRIDDDTLVIESHSFPSSEWGLAMAAQGGGADIPSSPRKTVTERYSVSEDGLTLFLDYTVDDPVYLTGPYSSRVALERVADAGPMDPFECDVESAKAWSRDSDDPPLTVKDE